MSSSAVSIYQVRATGLPKRKKMNQKSKSYLSPCNSEVGVYSGAHKGDIQHRRQEWTDDATNYTHVKSIYGEGGNAVFLPLFVSQGLYYEATESKTGYKKESPGISNSLSRYFPSRLPLHSKYTNNINDMNNLSRLGSFSQPHSYSYLPSTPKYNVFVLLSVQFYFKYPKLSKNECVLPQNNTKKSNKEVQNIFLTKFVI